MQNYFFRTYLDSSQYLVHQPFVALLHRPPHELSKNCDEEPQMQRLFLERWSSIV